MRGLSLGGLAVLGASMLGAADALADSGGKRHDGREYRRSDVERDLRHHEDERRAFIAGAAVQQHRNDYRESERYRDGYRDRYRDRYYESGDRHDDTGRVLVGVAIGAVATGVIMSNSNKE